MLERPLQAEHRPCSENSRNAQRTASRVCGRKRLDVANNCRKVTAWWKHERYDAIQTEKVVYKAWLQNTAKPFYSRNAEARSPQHSRWKGLRCNPGRISDINWIPITGITTKRFGKQSGILAAKHPTPLDASKFKKVSYSGIRRHLWPMDKVFQDSVKPSYYRTTGPTRGSSVGGKYHYCSRSFPGCRKTEGGKGCRLKLEIWPEMLKALIREWVLWLSRVCQVAWCSSKAAKDWQTGVIIPHTK